MKVAGALTLASGLLFAVVLALFPAKVSVLSTDVSCGPPVVGAFVYGDKNDEFGIEDSCQAQSVIRLVIGGIGGSVLVGAGLLMVLLTPDPLDRERERRREEHERFARWQWDRDRRVAWETQQQFAPPLPPLQPPPPRPEDRLL